MWISASSHSAITISGPPSIKKRLFEESGFFKSHKTATASIYAPYHAAHLIQESELSKIIGAATEQLFGNTKTTFPVCSSTSGKALTGENSLAVLKSALLEILQSPLHWDAVMKYCGTGDATDVKVHAIGPTNLASSMVSSLKALKKTVILEDASSWAAKPASLPQEKWNSDIAIIGMSGRFPDAASHELFWQLVEKGLDVHRPVPADRFPVSSHVDPAGKVRNTSHTPYGNFIENPGLFDARFFNMSPREAAQTDPMQRLMLVTAYEAMEMGGIVPGTTPSTKLDRIGTFYGQTSDDWREINAAQDIDTYFISGGVRAFGPGRINYFFKFSGPSFSVDTACSSSFAAVNIACTSLRAGECDMAFTGGANVLTNPDIFSGLSRGHFLSKTGSCKTFDDGADGYCRGDGVATVLLKRYADAIADKDPIIGVIKGMGTNHSADAVSITHPCASDQAFLFSKVMTEANVDPRDVNYVEMHGTGTQAGDGIEIESVTSVFAPRQNKRRADQPLYIGAVKSNIGHGEAVSGVSALIKVLMMLQNSAIPPHGGIKTVMNKTFPKDLGERNVNIAMKKTPLLRPAGGKRRVFINNFSAAGGNTAMLLEDGPEYSYISTDPRKHHVVSVSAKSLAAFKKSLAKMISYLGGNKNVDLANLAYTTTARRAHYNYRISYAVNDAAQLATQLKTLQDSVNATTHNPIPLALPQVAFAFTGQGSQYTAMGKKLYETSRSFRQDLEEFNEIAIRQGLPSFLSLVDGSVDVKDLSPCPTQLGMTCVQIALTRLWATWGIKPKVVIGHSLGEYAALNAAGVLSVADTIYLVGKRAELLEKMCSQGTHAMLAVRSPVAALQETISASNGKIEVACINGISDTVLSGTAADIDFVADKLTAAGQKSTKLKLPFAFHSSQVDPILAEFEQLASTVTFHRPTVPVISPLLSNVVNEAGVFGGAYLANHCRKAVDFVGGLTAALSTSFINNTSLWIEVGAHPICASMVKSVLSAPTLPSLRRDEDPWKIISSSVSAIYNAGVPFNWTAYHKEQESLNVLYLPFYGFDEKNYWLQYTGDWTLAKGGPVAAPVALAPAKVKSLNDAVQKVVSEEVKGKIATVVAESDLGSTALFKIVTGHTMNGNGLCPSSLYADMAYTITDHAYSLLKPGEKVDINVGLMDCPAPLILKSLKEPETQVIEIKVTVDLDTKTAHFTIMAGKTLHAKCVLTLENQDDWKLNWARTSYLVKDRMDMLRRKMEDGDADKIGRKMAYKLFSVLVGYSEKFQGMKNVILDSANLEAFSEIKLQFKPEDGNFKQSAYSIDSAAHLSGFIVNATVDSAGIYVSHGWESMRIAETLDPAKDYYSYVKMQPAGGKMLAGDVWIFNKEMEVVGLVGGLRFQCIPRNLMNVFLPPPGGAKKGAAALTKAAAPTASPAKKTVTLDIPKPTKKAARAPSPKPKAKKAAPGNAFLTKVWDIIATELAVDHSELNDQVQWADLGVDSLMSLTISGRLREELDFEVESTLFTDYASVGELKKYVSTVGGSDTSSDASTIDDSDASSESDEMQESGITTPDSEEFDMKPISAKSAAVEAVAAPADGEPDLIEVIRRTIAEEMEIEVEEIAETTDLSTLGMDSLMSLSILGSLREKCNIELDSTVLAENPSLGHLRKALGLTKTKPAAAPSLQEAVRQPEKSFAAEPSKPITPIVRMPPATSVLLQGNSKTATKNLFLFPDGSGSATSYVSIPAIDSQNLAVYGLNCPFMKDPTNYTCGIDGVSKLYLEEVLRRQPIGPYILGGWSAGGVVAFEVTRALDDLAKVYPDRNYYVEKLILIDSPCPIRLEPLPARLHHFFDEIGLLGTGTGKTPGWLLPHFEYSIKALTAYKPTLKSQKDFKAPPTLLIWATDGVCKNPEDPRPPPQEDDPKSMKWLLENRTDFGTNGWEKLVGAENCTMVKVEANHFTMMKPPVVSSHYNILH